MNVDSNWTPQTSAASSPQYIAIFRLRGLKVSVSDPQIVDCKHLLRTNNPERQSLVASGPRYPPTDQSSDSTS